MGRISYTVLITVLFIMSILYIGNVKSQGIETLSITRCEDSAAVISLIDSVFLENVNPLQIRNITFKGNPHAVGFFDGGSIFGFKRKSGIVLSTGFSEDLDNPNNCGGYENGTTNGGSDPDLKKAGNNATIQDACVIEFDFKPAGDTISFNYIFGSEEYHEWVSPLYADIFGFFLSGPGISGQYTNNGDNIAIVPGTNNAVSIGTVNCGDNDTQCAPPPGNGPGCEFLRDNSTPGTSSFQQCTMDAYTVPFVADNPVESCEWYHIKLAVGDYQDTQYDTGVFLEKGSFDPGNVSSGTEFTHPIINDVLYENCDINEATIYFSINTPRNDPFIMPYYIILDSVNGLAATDILTDYELIDNSRPDIIYIGEGELLDSIKIIAYSDDINEGIEHVSIRFNPIMCAGSFSSMDTSTVLISDTPAFPDSGFIFSTTCENQITINFGDSLGGVQPYSYDWYTLGVTAPTVDYTISGVKYDSIPCIVTDACQEQVNDTAWVIVPDLVADAGIDKSMCNVDSVSIDGYSVGAQHFYWESEPYDISIAGKEHLDTAWVLPIVETKYLLTVSDNCTNSHIDSVSVLMDDAVANAGIDMTICEFDTVTLVANGGPGFTWEWTASPGDITLAGQEYEQEIVVSPDGTTTYTVSVTNDCNKTATDDVIVIVNSLPNASAGIDSAVCFNQEYQLLASGGIEYLWTSVPNDLSLLDQDTLPNPLVVPPTQENYTYYVEVWDGNQCYNIDSMILRIDPVPNLGIIADNQLICFGDSASISAVGTANYTWTSFPNDPTLVGQEDQQTITIIPTETTTYTLVGVVSGFDCPATLTQTIEVKSELFSTFDVQDSEVCQGDIFTVMYSGNAIAAANYKWDFDNAQVIAGSGAGPIEVLWDIDGLKTIALSVDENGCTSDTSFSNITVLPTPDPGFDASPLEDCVPFVVNFTNNSSNIGSNVEYQWFFGNNDESTSPSPSYTYTEPGIYTVRLDVTNEGKCSSTITEPDYIVANELPISDFIADPEETVLDEPTITFTNTSTSIEALTYFWDFGDGNTSTDQSTENVYTQTGPYLVKLLVTTIDGGCESEIEKEVLIHPDFNVYAPNAFTPNGDGLNDVFELKGVGINKYLLQIYSRWGELMFETRDLEDHWDGTFQGELVPTGNYVYTIYYTSMINREFTKQGSVMVIR